MNIVRFIDPARQKDHAKNNKQNRANYGEHQQKGVSSLLKKVERTTRN
jgi:hypothetical protein